ncbi:hypothetical protein H0H87_000228 [Tephrocybe sp. NHM501043]|nr:hypothetical protein H0H87_000228 [Tephrocybe sp. NHM501043]
MTASSLYDVYNLPAVSQDLVSASLVSVACLKHNSKDSLIVAKKAIIPQIKGLLRATEPMRVKKRKITFEDKPSIWVKWALKKVDKAMFAQTKQRAEWLKLWRSQSGHLAGPAKF